MSLPRRVCNNCHRRPAVFRVAGGPAHPGNELQVLCDVCAIERQAIEPEVALVRLRGFALVDPQAVRAVASRGGRAVEGSERKSRFTTATGRAAALKRRQAS